MLKSLLLATFLSLATITSVSATPANFQKMITDTERGVVVIRVVSFDPVTRKNVSDLGTGFIIDKNLIVTNAHVIGSDPTGNKITVTVKDNNKLYSASVVSQSNAADIALLKLDTWDDFAANYDYKSLTFADSLALAQGDYVWSVGHPVGFQYTIAQGILASTYRSLEAGPTYELQADLQLLGGNSGGPLLNEKGEVIGINNVIVNADGGEESFAIPSNIVKKAVKELIAGGQVDWPYLGLGVAPKRDGNGRGVVIQNLLTDGSAYSTGVQEEDVIVGIKTKYTQKEVPINTISDFFQNIQILGKNDTFTFHLKRDDADVFADVTITTVKRDEDFPSPSFVAKIPKPTLVPPKGNDAPTAPTP